MKYVLSRLSFFIVSVWAAVTINFVLPRMMPGNPADAMFAKFQNNLTPQAMTALKTRIWVQQSTSDSPIFRLS